MTALDLANFDLAQSRQSLTDRLVAFRRRVRLHLAVGGIARVIAEAVGLAIVSLLLDRWLRLGVATRVGLSLIALAWLGWETWRWVVTPLRIQLGLIRLAAAADRAGGREHRDPLAPRVATVLELPELLKHDVAPSEAMVRQAVVAASASLASENFVHRLDQKRFRLDTSAIGAMLAVALLLIAINPATAGLWARRWLLASSEAWPQRTYLTLIGAKDGHIIVPRGEPLVLRISAVPGSLAPESVSLTMRTGKGPRSSSSMTRFADNDFRHDLPTVPAPITVWAEGSDDEFGPVEITPVDRPRLATLELVSQHPTEPAPTTHSFSGGESDLSFLPLTKLTLTFAATSPIQEVHLTATDGQPLPGELKRLDDKRFTVSWTHERAAHLQIVLVARDAPLESAPTPVSIGLKVDQPPRATLAVSGVRQRITPMAKIPLTVTARDDYGLASVQLIATNEFLDAEKKQQSTATTQPVYGPVTGPFGTAKEMEVSSRQTLDVAALKVPVNSLLQVSTRATDACHLGPQTQQSRATAFRIVAPEELFREILLRQQGERAKFRKAIDQVQAVRDQLTTLPNPAAAGPLSRQHRATQREIQRIATSLSESLTEMKLNGLGGKEAYDLMEGKILAPLKQVNDDLMNPQRDALDGLSVAVDLSALTSVTERQADTLQKLQDVLKSMSQWDSFVDIVNQLNEIIRLQEQARQSTEELKKKQADSVFDP